MSENSNRPRIAVAGAGVFGRNHLRVIRDSGRATLTGVFDTDQDRAGAAAREFGCAAAGSLEELAGMADAAVVAVPTTHHHAVAAQLMEAGLDVLVEKPISVTTEEARSLCSIAARRGRILQVGHLERFNPAVLAMRSVLTRPLFFEIHRLSVFSPRSLDVDVVADLMIHDLDILLSITGTMPEEIRAAGIPILSPKADIASVRLAFPGGVIANLTASRASTERVRKLRLFQPRQYISVDYARQDCVAIGVDENRQVQIQQVPVEKREPLAVQLDAFIDSMLSREAPAVDGIAAARALQAARMILDKIEEHTALVARTLAGGAL
ncbi:MAG: Gfo/Idh/MocA family oxidoreductase [Bryobacteraceae bacterium]|nr:Gfo/Idh/MocA family oxidoreductase [Bryobacteraceae bacterium]